MPQAATARRLSIPPSFFCLLSLIFLAIFVLPTTAQGEPTCHILTDPTCNQFVPVGTPIFVAPDYGYDYEALVMWSNRIVNLLNFAPVVHPCYELSLQLICLTWLRPCQNSSLVGGAVIPQEPCMNLCTNFYNTCALAQAAAGEAPGLGFYFPVGYFPPLNCSDNPVDIWAGNSSFYRPALSNYTFNDTVYPDLPCSALDPVVNVDRYCAPPLKEVVAEINGANQCAFVCPLPSLTSSQYDNVKIMQGILGWLSWCGTAVLILSLLFNPTTRDFPRNMILMVACAANVAAGAIILPTYAGYDNTWCGGSNEILIPDVAGTTYSPLGLPDFSFSVSDSVLSFNSSLCTFQGAMLQFGFLAAVFWWVAIAFNMCLELFLVKVVDLAVPKWKWLRFGIYNAIVWGLAFLCMVIPASAGYINFAPGGTYCFVSTEQNNRWILSFWFIPVGLAVFFGVLFFLIAIVRVSIMLVMLKKVKTLVFLYLRLFIFIFLFLFLFTFIFAYNIQIASDSSSITQGYEDYYKCLVYAQDDCSLSDSVSNYNLIMLKGFAISSLGTFIFLIFFFAWDSVKFYGFLIKYCILGAIHRDLSEMGMAYKMVLSSRTTPGSVSLSKSAGLSLSKVSDSAVPDEEDEDKDKIEKDSDDEESNKSESSEEKSSSSE